MQEDSDTGLGTEEWVMSTVPTNTIHTYVTVERTIEKLFETLQTVKL